MRAENGDMCPSTQITASIQKSGSGTTTTNLRYIFLNVFDGGPYGHLGHFGLVAADAATRRLTPYDGYGSYNFESCQDVRALRQDASEAPSRLTACFWLVACDGRRCCRRWGDPGPAARPGRDLPGRTGVEDVGGVGQRKLVVARPALGLLGWAHALRVLTLPFGAVLVRWAVAGGGRRALPAHRCGSRRTTRIVDFLYLCLRASSRTGWIGAPSPRRRPTSCARRR